MNDSAHSSERVCAVEGLVHKKKSAYYLENHVDHTLYFDDTTILHLCSICRNREPASTDSQECQLELTAQLVKVVDGLVRHGNGQNWDGHTRLVDDVHAEQSNIRLLIAKAAEVVEAVKAVTKSENATASQ
jgi:hypothetical protein